MITRTAAYLLSSPVNTIDYIHAKMHRGTPHNEMTESHVTYRTSYIHMPLNGPLIGSPQEKIHLFTAVVW